MFKKHLALALVILMLTGIMTGCGAQKNKTVLEAGMAYVPLSFDPHQASPQEMVLTQYFYEPLLWRGESDPALQAAGAQSWRKDTVAIEEMPHPAYVFSIRQGSSWSDKKALRAQDYLYGIQRLFTLTPTLDFAQELAQYILNGDAVLRGEKPLEELGVTASEDGATLTILLAHDNDALLELLAHPMLAPLRQDIIETHPDTWDRDGTIMVSSGPYTIDMWAEGVLSMKLNASYWNQAYIRNGAINWQLSDADGTLRAIADNTIAAGYAALDTQWAKAKTDTILSTTPQLGALSVVFNQASAPFKETPVREAFVRAIDAPALLGGLYEGRFTPTTSLIGAGGGSLFDADAAARALSGAGFSGGRGLGDITLLCGPDAVHQTIAQALATAWQDALHVSVTVESLQGKPLREALASGAYQVALVEQRAYSTNLSTLFARYTQGSKVNLLGYADDAYDALVQEALAAPDANDAADKLAQAQTLLLGDYALLPLCNLQQELLYKPSNLSGCRFDAMGRIYIEDSSGQIPKPEKKAD